jgi:hypothetical protein
MVHMEDIGLLVKSYSGDARYARRLMSSIERHNVERLPVWVVVPDADVPLFREFVHADYQLLAESIFAQHLVDEPIGELRVGYANQEIIKLAFAELGLAANYFTVDSDAVFVRDFGRDDFMFDAHTPYTVLVEDNDLKVDPDYYRNYWVGRDAALRRIQQEVGLNDRRMLTCHGHQILSAEVLRSLREDFLAPRGWRYQDMLAIAPYEYSWYNFWLQATKPIPIHIREPLIKVLHSADQHLVYAMAGITPEDVARGYLGIVVNSNFARTWGMDVHHDEPPAATIARYLSWSTLLESARIKTASALKGRLGR